MVFAHFPAGYLTSHILTQKASLTREAHFAIWLGSIAPDFDLIFTLFFPETSHRLYPTHIPFFYLLLTFLFLTGYITSKRKSILIILYFLIGCWVHLLLDSPTGLLLLYPINTNRFQLTAQRLSFFEYFQTPLFYLEFLFIVPFVLLFFRNRRPNSFISR